ncbi:hypothetical protein [Fibrella forsythiae]|uniref:Uncharacterized protein n=1 Tax=Fibrella forsythiae TaxID=2817061 RepID=A0ABS3JSP0_9BACT|nr:hypothetical protein [Fibrella forsythiae]MBO0953032.1 hypothetical protein [Fibrella forsythiae]
MNTVQNYVQSTGGATPLEPTTQTLATIKAQLETLQNVVLTLENPAFRLRYSYVATLSEHRLEQDLTRVIGELDPLLVEAIA